MNETSELLDGRTSFEDNSSLRGLERTRIEKQIQGNQDESNLIEVLTQGKPIKDLSSIVAKIEATRRLWIS